MEIGGEIVGGRVVRKTGHGTRLRKTRRMSWRLARCGRRKRKATWDEVRARPERRSARSKMMTRRETGDWRERRWMRSAGSGVAGLSRMAEKRRRGVWERTQSMCVTVEAGGRAAVRVAFLPVVGGPCRKRGKDTAEVSAACTCCSCGWRLGASIALY